MSTKKIRILNIILATIAMVSIVVATGICSINSMAKSKTIVKDIAGKEETLTFKESIGAIDYYSGDYASFAFKNGVLVSVEDPVIKSIDIVQLSLKEKALAYAGFFLKMDKYVFITEDIYPGECHEFVWGVLHEGIETQDKVIVDIFEDGSINFISFPLYGFPKTTYKYQKKDIKVSEKEVNKIFIDSVLKKHPQDIVSISITSSKLLYNAKNELVWSIIGESELKNKYGEISEYIELQFSIVDGSMINEDY